MQEPHLFRLTDAQEIREGHTATETYPTAVTRANKAFNLLKPA